MVIMLATVGDKLKHLIRFCIISFERKILKKKRTSNIQKKTLFAVLITAIFFHLMFSAAAQVHDNWDFSLALYVWFVTLTTIGFGDFVPHIHFQESRGDSTFISLYLMIVFFIGMSLVATVLQASSDWMESKKPPTKDELKRSLKCMLSSFSKRKDKPSTSTLQQLPRPYLVHSYL